MSNILQEYVKIKMEGASKGNGTSCQKIEDILDRLIQRSTSSFTLLDIEKEDLFLESVSTYTKLKSYSLSKHLKLLGKVKTAISLGKISQTKGRRILLGLEGFDEEDPEQTVKKYTIHLHSPIGEIQNIIYSENSPDIILPTNFPQYDAYRFDGWYNNSEFSGDPITTIESKTTGDIHLYSKWILKIDEVLTSCNSTYTIIKGKNNTLYGTGRNTLGQLGLGDLETRYSFENINIPDIDINFITVGSRHTIISEGQDLWFCGNNTNGQFGVNNPRTSEVFDTFPGTPTNIKMITGAGGTITLVLTNDGKLYSAGSNGKGQLGLPTTAAVRAFTLVDYFDEKIVKIATGGTFTLALTESGKVYVCGSNEYGQLGIDMSDIENVTDRYISTFTHIPFPEPIEDIACGSGFSYVKTVSQKLYSTGRNNYGQLGLGDTGAGTERNTFTLIENFNHDIVKISCGSYHVMIITSDNEVYATGMGLYGQIGFNNTANKRVLTKTPLSDYGIIKDITTGYAFTLMITEDGRLFSFGYNNNGQLGFGDTVTQIAVTEINVSQFQVL